MYEFNSQQINPDALNQGEVWYNADGTCHKIKDMPFSYVRNVIRFLHSKGWKLNAHSSVLMKALKKRQEDAINELSQ